MSASFDGNINNFLANLDITLRRRTVNLSYAILDRLTTPGVTPVSTGHLVSNWRVTLNPVEIAIGSRERVDYSDKSSLRFRNYVFDFPIFIINPVPYGPHVNSRVNSMFVERALRSFTQTSS